MEIRPILSSLLRNKTGALLIAAQVALSLAIVANALYIIQDRVARVARPSGVADEHSQIRFAVTPIKNLESPEAKIDLQQRVGTMLRALPGVASVAMTNQLPLSTSGWNMGLSIDTKQPETTTNTAMYFGPDSLVQTLGLKLIEGRDFTAEDVEVIDPDKTKSLGRIAILTKATADKLFPGGGSAVGKTIYLGTGADAFPLQVVGVVERLQTPWAQNGERGEISTILASRYVDTYLQYAIRAEPGQRDRVMKEAEAALRKIPGMMVVSNESMDENRHDIYRDDRAIAWMLATVTVLLLLVTGSGVVGMATLWVNQRRKQIGVRRALGARKVDILRYFITENVLITTGGIVAGLLLAVGLNQLLVSQLELPKLPVMYLAVAPLVLWLVGIAAVYAPAWRASGISPATATRSA
jgi:putative ABC transport system permease protein